MRRRRVRCPGRPRRGWRGTRAGGRGSRPQRSRAPVGRLTGRRSGPPSRSLVVCSRSRAPGGCRRPVAARSERRRDGAWNGVGSDRRLVVVLMFAMSSRTWHGRCADARATRALAALKVCNTLPLTSFPSCRGASPCTRVAAVPRCASQVVRTLSTTASYVPAIPRGNAATHAPSRALRDAVPVCRCAVGLTRPTERASRCSAASETSRPRVRLRRAARARARHVGDVRVRAKRASPHGGRRRREPKRGWRFQTDVERREPNGRWGFQPAKYAGRLQAPLGPPGRVAPGIALSNAIGVGAERRHSIAPCRVEDATPISLCQPGREFNHIRRFAQSSK